jgi:hypothetical protein
MGELFQGAAKGLLDRGEKLGINQAVRDAVGEAKKNVSGISAWCISDYVNPVHMIQPSCWLTIVDAKLASV